MRSAALRLLLLVPALCGAGEVPRVPSLKAAVTPAPVAVSGQMPPIVPGAMPSIAVPTELSAGLPALPRSELARPLSGSRRGFLPWAEGLERLRLAAVAAEKAAEAGPAPEDAGRVYFDGGSAAGEATPRAWSPAAPEGAVRVDVDHVLGLSDVSKLIPESLNSKVLIEELKASVDAMAPYRVYTYHDSLGGRFTGIDLSLKPGLVEILPEQQSHEVRLIKKIQLYNKDLQVVVREDGKTPDLIMGGMVTELKSRVREQTTLGELVNHANTQVYEHAKRHALGDGAVVVDLVHDALVPVPSVIQELDSWSRHPVGAVFSTHKDDTVYSKSPNALQRVYVFSRGDMKLFERRKDGSYKESRETRASRKTPPAARIARKVHTAQLLLKAGRAREAAALVRHARAVEKSAGIAGAERSQLAQAKERIDALKTLERMKKLARRRRFGPMRSLWDDFKQDKPDESLRDVQAAVERLFGEETEGELIQREIDGPRAALEKRGVKTTIAVYGGARVEPGSRWYREARKFGKLVGKNADKSVALVTGGGPGIMEAANRGARSAGGASVGHNIILPNEQAPNGWQTPGLSFHYQSFAARKSNLRHAAAAHVYFPGGFGTMDELFELLTLIQTGKLAKAPIVLVGGKSYWSEVLDFKAFSRLGLIADADLDLFTFAENAQDAWAIVAQALRGGAGSRPPSGKDPLAGLSLFERLDAEKKFMYESGKPGEIGYRRAEHWPRTGEWKYQELRRGLHGAGVVSRKWEYDERTGLGRVMVGESDAGADREQLRRIAPILARLARIFKVPKPSVDEYLGFPELEAVLEAKDRAPAVDPADLKPGDFVLSKMGERNFTVFQLASTDVTPNDSKGKTLYRFYARDWEAIGAPALEVLASHIKSLWLRTNDGTHRRGDEGLVAYKTEGEGGLWRLTETEAAAFARYAPRETDPTSGGKWTREQVALFASLQSLQYERWGVDEIDALTRGNAKAKRARLKGRYAQATVANYAKALDALFERFGAEAFEASVKRVMEAHLHGLHTELHHHDLLWKAHSDIAPLGRVYTRLASEATGGVHPVPYRMTESGYIVNAKSLFGDADFWRYMSERRPETFASLVDWLLGLPRPFAARGIYGGAELDVAGLIKARFPEAFALIHAARPDFDSDASQPIVLSSKR